MRTIIVPLAGLAVLTSAAWAARAASPVYCALYAKEFVKHAAVQSQGSIPPKRIHDRAYHMDDEPLLPTAYADRGSGETGRPFSLVEGSNEPAENSGKEAAVEAAAAPGPVPDNSGPKQRSCDVVAGMASVVLAAFSEFLRPENRHGRSIQDGRQGHLPLTSDGGSDLQSASADQAGDGDQYPTVDDRGGTSRRRHRQYENVEELAAGYNARKQTGAGADGDCTGAQKPANRRRQAEDKHGRAWVSAIRATAPKTRPLPRDCRLRP